MTSRLRHLSIEYASGLAWTLYFGRDQALLSDLVDPCSGALDLTSAHELRERGQETLDTNAAHVDELPRQESLPVPCRNRCRKNHLRRRFRPGEEAVWYTFGGQSYKFDYSDSWGACKSIKNVTRVPGHTRGHLIYFAGFQRGGGVI